MTSKPKRDLIKGPLRPPKWDPSNRSYTQLPASKDEVSIRAPGEQKEITGSNDFFVIHITCLRYIVREFSSTALPQPFLDPSIIQRRIEANKKWQAEQDRKKNQATTSQET